MLTGSALNAGNNNGYNTDFVKKPAFQSRALSTNSGYNAHSPSLLPEESQAPISEENKLFSLKSTHLTKSPEFHINQESEYKNNDKNELRPIIPVLTTYNSGKIHQSTESKSANINPQLKLNAQARFNRLNIYGIEPELNAAKPKAYEAPLAEIESESIKRKKRPRFDLSELTVNEVKQLESIHRKLFNTTSDSGKDIMKTKIFLESTTRNNLSNINAPEMFFENEIINQEKNRAKSEESVKYSQLFESSETSTTASLLIYQKPSEGKMPHSSVNALMNLGSADSLQNLDPEVLNELSAIKDLPDLDELTKDMDLSLLNKPGGFAILKQQFIERLIQRTLGRRKRLRDSTFNNQKIYS